MPDTILIDGQKYQAIIKVSAAHKNTLPKHTLEDGSTATDHIYIGTPEFELNMILFQGEYDRLLALSKEQRLISVTLPQGTYSNVAIQSISDSYGRSLDTTECTLSLAVQRVISSSTAPTLLDGLSTGTAQFLGATTKSTLAVSDVSVEQLVASKLSGKNSLEAKLELEKIEKMSDIEKWTYLVPEQEKIIQNGELKILSEENSAASGRTILNYDPLELSSSAKFSWKNASYGLTSRTETINKQEVTHITVTRIRDNAIVYNGTLHDLTPISLTDPETGILEAVLELNKKTGKVYIG